MVVRSPLEKTVFTNMVYFLISLKVIDIINKHDNYPVGGKTYSVLYHIIVDAYNFKANFEYRLREFT